jgi:hypothetical protein
MNYAKLYVDVYSHPRFIEAGFEASGYWMHALASLRHQESSDGFLSEATLTVPLAARKAQCRRLCEKLVSVGLFRKVEGGYVLLRYAEKNETKAEIDQARLAARERLVRHRDRLRGRSEAPLDPLPSNAGVKRVSPVLLSSVYVSDSVSGSDAGGDGPLTGTGPPPRRPLPPSERSVSGSYWLAAFTEGITKQTGRPCTTGRMYVSTLERIVEHHAPARDAPQACVWLREQAAAFAAKWEGHHPGKGLTPDGLERWLNDGRGGPPSFGHPQPVQVPASAWTPDDFSDLGARVVQYGARETTNGKTESHE